MAEQHGHVEVVPGWCFPQGAKILYWGFNFSIWYVGINLGVLAITMVVALSRISQHQTF